jgi:hypothetical protein
MKAGCTPRRAALPLLLPLLLGAALLPSVKASAAEDALAPPKMLAAQQQPMSSAAAAVARSLAQLDALDQQQVLCAVARAHGPEGAPLPSVCVEGALSDHGAAHGLRLLAASGGGGSGSAAASGSGGHHQVNREHIELMVVAVIMITVVFEIFTHWLDRIAAPVPHIFQIVQRVYKELMLLGIISFGLFFFESNFTLAPSVSHELHEIHILIFFIAIAYIAEAIFTLAVSNLVAARSAANPRVPAHPRSAPRLRRD